MHRCTCAIQSILRHLHDKKEEQAFALGVKHYQQHGELNPQMTAVANMEGVEYGLIETCIAMHAAKATEVNQVGMEMDVLYTLSGMRQGKRTSEKINIEQACSGREFGDNGDNGDTGGMLCFSICYQLCMKYTIE